MVVMIIVVVVMLGFTPFFFAVEHHKVQAERIKRGNKHTGHQGKVGKAAGWQIGGVHRFDNRVFGVKAGEKRRANQRQGTD